MLFDWSGGLLGLMALASMAVAHCCPPADDRAEPASHHGQHQAPEKKQPEMPGACHAVMGCAAHRRLRTFA
jgi:hypothetical protein